jgi:hypothetical protein
MNKIGVMSSYACIYSSNNYGALLQYYALQEYLKARGHNPYWIRSILPQSKLYLFLRHLKNYRNLLLLNNYYSCHFEFMNFVYKYLNVSRKTYHGNADLYENCPLADFYITGSDQVWGGKLEENYLLFVRDNDKKLAYAASFGSDNLSEEHISTITPWVQRFRKVSVREKSGVDICRQMSVDAIQLLDPTLLIDRSLYENLYKGMVPKGNGLFCYFLNLNSLEDICWNGIKKYSFESDTEISVACSQYSEIYFPKKNLYFPSPSEWLSYYSNSKAIVTNTFHGTVFALIFRKTFVTILQSGETASQNTRLFSLLQDFHLEDRIWDGKSELASMIKKPIDWDSFNSVLEEKQKLSDAFFNDLGL